MTPWFWILIGAIGGIVAVVLSVVVVSAAIWFWDWLRWKRRQLRLRREWTMENPYWREAFDAGAKWAREGEPRAEPNLTRLRMPERKAKG